MTFSWNAATDSATPQASLTYNLRVGTSPGAGDVVHGMSDVATGRRHVPVMGNAQQNSFRTIRGLAASTYYWSVQAIDSGFMGSEWAPEQQITVP